MKKNLQEMEVKAINKSAILESHDGEEFSLITVAKNVLCEDGTTMQDYSDNHSEPNISTKIVNSNSMSKVGQGDNVDFSDNVVNGAYESMVLKGKSMVNCIQEPSSQDVVLPYEFEEGQYVTINDTKESGALGVELKGQTLVNLKGVISKNPQWVETDDAFCLDLPADNGQPNISVKFTSPLKRNTEYTVFVNIKSYTTGYPHICFMDETNRVLASDREWTPAKAGVLKTKFTTSSTVDAYMLRIIPRNGIDNTYTFSKEFIILEGDYTNVDIPYFEGMASCKMPILCTVGKNLFNPTKMIINDGALYGYYKYKNDESVRCTLSISDKDTSVDISGIYFGMTVLGKNADGGVDWLIGNGSISYPNTLSVTTNNNFISIYPNNTETLNKLTERFNVQLEYSEVKTTYEPCKTSILSLPEEVVLRSLSNGVRDTFNTRTGVYTQMVQEFVFDGSDDEGWMLTDSSASHETMIAFEVKNRDYMNNLNKYDNQPLLNNLFRVYTDKSWNYFDDEHFRQWGDGSSMSWVCVIPRSKLSSVTVEGFKSWLSKNPMKVVAKLKTPIITKVNLSSTLKSWNTTTHIYSEIPENTLYPILSHSNPSYPVILKPSTKYSIVANSYSNDHTNSAIKFNLGGATASTTVGSRVTTITTPSTLSNELLTMGGRGNKLNNVMVIEGDVAGDEPYFEGMCDSKSPILSNVGKNLFDEQRHSNPDNFFVHSSYWSIPIRLKGNTEYRFSYTFNNVLDKQVVMRFATCKWTSTNHSSYPYSLGQVLNRNITSNLMGKTDSMSFVTPADGLVYLHYYNTELTNSPSSFNLASWYTHILKDIQLEESSTSTQCEPYKSNTTTFDQKDNKTIVLRSLPNGVCDTLNVETGEYVQRIGEIVLDGSEDGWGVSIGNPNVNYPTFTNNSIMQDVVNINSGNYRTLKPLCNKYSSYSQAQLFNVVDSPTPVTKGIAYRWDGYGLGVRDDDRFNYDSEGLELFKQSLAQNPITVQYELAKPITKTVDISGYPYAYESGHVLLESGSQEQSLTPTIEYSIVANRGGQIRSNQRMVERHQKKLDSLYAMTLVNMIDSQYKQVLMKLKSELGSEVRTWDIE